MSFLSFLTKSKKDFTISLVGNAESLNGKGLGDTIDGSSSFVFRINKGWNNTRMNSKDWGRRTNMMFVNLYRTVRITYPRDIPTYQLTPCDSSEYLSKLATTDYWTVEKDTIDDLRENHLDGHNPSTGMRAIWTLIFQHQIPPERITLYGFDHKKTPSFFLGKRDSSRSNHNFEKEGEFVDSIVGLKKVY